MGIFFAVLIAFGAQILSIFTGYHLITRYIDRKQAEIVRLGEAEINTLVKGEPCTSGRILLAIGQTVGREAGRSAKQALLGDAATAKRLTNDAVDDTLVGALTESQPALGNILAGMGKNQRKGLLGNPLVQLALQGLTGGAHGGAPAPNPGNNEPRGSFSL